MYGQLGDIIFEGLYGPEEFVRTDSVSLPLHNRIGLRPKIQFTGNDLGTVKIGIHLHRSFIDVEEALDRFRSYRTNVSHLRYITGTGSVIGTFVIAGSKQTNKQETPRGEIVSCVLEVNLLETTASRPKTVAVNNAIANRNNNPAITLLEPRPATIPVSAALDVSLAVSQANLSDSMLSHYEGPATPSLIDRAKATFARASRSVATARDKAASAAAKVQAASETAQQAQAYVANMYTAVQNANVLEQYLNAFDPNDPVGSINNVVNANSQFMGSVSVMTNTSQPLAAFTGTRAWQ
jgi:phage protein U